MVRLDITLENSSPLSFVIEQGRAESARRSSFMSSTALTCTGSAAPKALFTVPACGVRTVKLMTAGGDACGGLELRCNETSLRIPITYDFSDYHCAYGAYASDEHMRTTITYLGKSPAKWAAPVPGMDGGVHRLLLTIDVGAKNAHTHAHAHARAHTDAHGATNGATNGAGKAFGADREGGKENAAPLSSPAAAAGAAACRAAPRLLHTTTW